MHLIICSRVLDLTFEHYKGCEIPLNLRAANYRVTPLAPLFESALNFIRSSY